MITCPPPDCHPPPPPPDGRPPPPCPARGGPRPPCPPPGGPLPPQPPPGSPPPASHPSLKRPRTGPDSIQAARLAKSDGRHTQQHSRHSAPSSSNAPQQQPAAPQSQTAAAVAATAAAAVPLSVAATAGSAIGAAVATYHTACPLMTVQDGQLRQVGLVLVPQPQPQQQPQQPPQQPHVVPLYGTTAAHPPAQHHNIMHNPMAHAGSHPHAGPQHYKHPGPPAAYGPPIPPSPANLAGIIQRAVQLDGAAAAIELYSRYRNLLTQPAYAGTVSSIVTCLLLLFGHDGYASRAVEIYSSALQKHVQDPNTQSKWGCDWLCGVGLDFATAPNLAALSSSAYAAATERLRQGAPCSMYGIAVITSSWKSSAVAIQPDHVSGALGSFITAAGATAGSCNPELTAGTTKLLLQTVQNTLGNCELRDNDSEFTLKLVSLELLLLEQLLVGLWVDQAAGPDDICQFCRLCSDAGFKTELAAMVLHQIPGCIANCSFTDLCSLTCAVGYSACPESPALPHLLTALGTKVTAVVDAANLLQQQQQQQQQVVSEATAQAAVRALLGTCWVQVIQQPQHLGLIIGLATLCCLGSSHVKGIYLDQLHYANACAAECGVRVCGSDGQELPGLAAVLGPDLMSRLHAARQQTTQRSPTKPVPTMQFNFTELVRSLVERCGYNGKEVSSEVQVTTGQGFMASVDACIALINALLEYDGSLHFLKCLKMPVPVPPPVPPPTPPIIAAALPAAAVSSAPVAAPAAAAVAPLAAPVAAAALPLAGEAAAGAVNSTARVCCGAVALAPAPAAAAASSSSTVACSSASTGAVSMASAAAGSAGSASGAGVAPSPGSTGSTSTEHSMPVMPMTPDAAAVSAGKDTRAAVQATAAPAHGMKLPPVPISAATAAVQAAAEFARAHAGSITCWQLTRVPNSKTHLRNQLLQKAKGAQLYCVAGYHYQTYSGHSKRSTYAS